MVTVNIRLSTGGKNIIAQLDSLRKKIPNAAAQLSIYTAREMARMARQNVHDRAKWHGKTPGQLESGIRARTVAMSRLRKTYSVTASAKSEDGFDYASAVESGTKGHQIVMPIGSMGDALARGWRSNTDPFWIGVNRISHRHPGAQPMNFMRDAFNLVVKNTDEYIKRMYDPIAGLHTLR